MEISKKDIKCREIVEQIERLTSSIRQFIRLVNCSIQKEIKLNKESIIIERQEDTAYLNDGNTACSGYEYNIFWSYTPKDVEVTNTEVKKLIQPKAITFVLECKERCFDHTKDRSQFLSLYYKDNSLSEQAERIDYINDNYDENYLFKPYELMQVVWRIKNVYGLYPKNIPEDATEFEKFAKNFENENIKLEVDRKDKITKELSKEVLDSIDKFHLAAHRFTTIVNCYCATSTGKVTIQDLQKLLHKGDCTANLQKAMNDFYSNEVFDPKGKQVYPKSFIWQRDEHCTLHYNERPNTFCLFDCIKSIIGYTYFNDHVYLRGIAENWYPRLLYFSYYISKDYKECYYTISMTGCEGRFRKNYIHVIEAKTLEELLTPENAIKVAKWLEKIWEKTSLMNYYSLLIKNKRVRNFSTSCEID